MRLTKQMIQVYKEVTHSVQTIKTLAKKLHLSENYISEVIEDLTKEGFVTKIHDKGIGTARVKIVQSGRNYTMLLKELMYEKHYIKFKEILPNSKLLFLAAICDDWITLKEASKLCGVSLDMIRKFKPNLQNRGIIIKQKSMYKINSKGWPLLKQFIHSYKNYSELNGKINWRYNKEALITIDREKDTVGSSSGLIKYQDYGVKVWVVKAICRLPQKKLTKEEVFVHSLFEVNDPRTLCLALTFYIKNKLNEKKVVHIAMKYGKYSMFQDFLIVLKSRQHKLKLPTLPIFDYNDFKRIAHMYEVKNV